MMVEILDIDNSTTIWHKNLIISASLNMLIDAFPKQHKDFGNILHNAKLVQI